MKKILLMIALVSQLGSVQANGGCPGAFNTFVQARLALNAAIQSGDTAAINAANQQLLMARSTYMEVCHPDVF